MCTIGIPSCSRMPVSSKCPIAIPRMPMSSKCLMAIPRMPMSSKCPIAMPRMPISSMCAIAIPTETRKLRNEVLLHFDGILCCFLLGSHVLFHGLLLGSLYRSHVLVVFLLLSLLVLLELCLGCFERLRLLFVKLLDLLGAHAVCSCIPGPIHLMSAILGSIRRS